jgi:hypothetical protein
VSKAGEGDSGHSRKGGCVKRFPWALVYALLALVCLRHLLGFWMPHTGFTSWIAFGDDQAVPISMLREVDFFLHEGFGYDGQSYAQLACQPNLTDPELATGVDSVSYRARRILPCWSAYLLGGGQPYWILQAYALQPLLAWMALAIVLLRWYPPRNFDSTLRWGLTLTSWGMLDSIHMTVPDLPALLLTVAALLCFESGRKGWALALVAVATLVRETSLLGLLMFVPTRSLSSWAKTCRTWLIGMAPLVLWLLYLKLICGLTSGSGATANFAWPGQGWWFRARELMALELSGPHWTVYLFSRLSLLSLSVQAWFVLLRPQPTSAAWRVAAGYVVLMLMIGSAVWEGQPGASLRVLLPLTVLFNRLVPAGRWALPLLILGNFNCFIHCVHPRVPFFQGFTYRHHLCRDLRIHLDQPWDVGRTRDFRTRAQASQSPAKVALLNRGKRPHRIQSTGRIVSDRPASLRFLSSQGEVLWQGQVGLEESRFDFKVAVPSGETHLSIEWSTPAQIQLLDVIIEVVDEPPSGAARPR